MLAELDQLLADEARKRVREVDARAAEMADLIWRETEPVFHMGKCREIAEKLILQQMQAPKHRFA